MVNMEELSPCGVTAMRTQMARVAWGLHGPLRAPHMTRPHCHTETGTCAQLLVSWAFSKSGSLSSSLGDIFLHRNNNPLHLHSAFPSSQRCLYLAIIRLCPQSNSAARGGLQMPQPISCGKLIDQQIGPFDRPGLLGSRKGSRSRARGSFDPAEWQLVPVFCLPLLLSVDDFLHSSNPVQCPGDLHVAEAEPLSPAPLCLGLSILALYCPTLQQDHSELTSHH